MQTGRNLGLGCLLPQAASRLAGLCGPTLLEGGDKNTLSTSCVPNPCYVLGTTRKGTSKDPNSTLFLVVEHIL